MLTTKDTKNKRVMKNITRNIPNMAKKEANKEAPSGDTPRRISIYLTLIVSISYGMVVT